MNTCEGPEVLFTHVVIVQYLYTLHCITIPLYSTPNTTPELGEWSRYQVRGKPAVVCQEGNMQTADSSRGLETSLARGWTLLQL